MHSGKNYMCPCRMLRISAVTMNLLTTLVGSMSIFNLATEILDAVHATSHI